MGRGREVADAYIEVHGDLSKFRDDLNDANGTMSDWAEEQADTFSETWGKRMKATMDRQWSSVVDSMQSGKQLDFSRMIKNFDGDDIDEAGRKITEMLDAMRDAGKLTDDQLRDTSGSITKQIGILKKQQRLEADLAADRASWGRAHETMMKQARIARKESADAEASMLNDALAANKRFDAARKKMLTEAIAMNRQYDAGQRQRAQIHDTLMKRMAASERRMYDEAFRLNREHDDRLARSAKIRESLQRALADAERKMLTEASAENARFDAARRKMVEQAIRDNEAWGRSFTGVMDAARKMDLEAKFKALGQAMATGDWSKISNGAKDMGQLENRTMATAREMRSLGRITNDQFAQIEDRLKLVRGNIDAYNIRFAQVGAKAKEHSRDWSIISTMIGNAGKKFAGFTGLNVIGDMFQEGARFFQDLDRNAVSIGKMTLLIGSAASTIISAVGGVAVIGQDLAKIGQIGILAPGFLTAAGISVGVLVAAFKDMGTVLEDLGPRFGALQDVISANFWAAAEQPIRNLVDGLLPTLEGKLAQTATSLGGLTAALANAIGGVDTERISGMFDRMNAGIDIAVGAMQPLVDAFTTLGEVGSGYFERFATWIVEISTQFNNFIQTAAADGRLNQWVEEAIQALKDVGSILGSVVGIFNAIGDAAEAAGIGGLTPFADALAGISAVMNSGGFQTTLTTLFAGAADAARTVGDAILGLGPAISSIMPTISGVLMGIGETMATVIGYIGQVLQNPMVQNGLTLLIGGITKGVAALAPAIGPLGDSLGQVGELLGQVAAQVGEIVAAFVVNLSPVLDQITGAFARITFAAGPEIIKIIEILGPLFQTLVSTLLPPLENLIMTVLPLLSGAFAALAPIFPVLATAIAPIIEAFQQLIAIVGPVLIPAIQQIVEALTPVIEVIGQVVGAVLDFLVPILGALLTSVIGNLVGVFQGLSDFIMGFVTIVTAIFTGFGAFFTKLFEGDIGGALDALGTMFKQIWDGIKQMVSGAVQAIWNAIQLYFVGKLVMGVKTALTSVAGFFKSSWDDILNFAKRTMSNLQSAINAGLSAIGTFFRTIWNTITSVVRVAWTTITQGVNAGISQARNFVSNGLNSIKSFFSTAWNNMVTIVTTAFTRIVTGVSNGVTSAMNFVRGIPGKITSALGNLGGLLLGAGGAIMDGLLGGIQAGFDRVKNVVGGIAGWIRDNKGPLPYDRVLLIPAGNAIMDGLARGLEDKLPMLRGVLQTVTDTMSDGVTAAFAKSKMYVAGADAALGLANGLKDNKGAVVSALGALLPSSSTSVSARVVGRGDPGFQGVGGPTPQPGILVEAGAIQINTPTKDPVIVAEKVIDDLAAFSNL